MVNNYCKGKKKERIVLREIHLRTTGRHLSLWHRDSSVDIPLPPDQHSLIVLRSTVSVVLALPTSKMSACRCRILLLGALSVWRSVVTCLFLEQEQ